MIHTCSRLYNYPENTIRSSHFQQIAGTQFEILEPLRQLHKGAPLKQTIDFLLDGVL